MPGRTTLDEEKPTDDQYFLEFEKATNFKYSGLIGDLAVEEILGFNKEVQYSLIIKKLLKTVGKKDPAPNTPKQYTLRSVVLLRRDQHWLERAAEVVANSRVSKNASKKGRQLDPKHPPLPKGSP
jgi:hypothetical protein